MPKNKRYHPPQKETVDPYTGEKKPVPEDAENMYEEVRVDSGDRRGKKYLLEEESSMDSAAADGDSMDAAEQAAHFTDDDDVKEDFIDRQGLAHAGRKSLQEELEEHNSRSPKLSAGDLDADWQSANQSGEETVGGSSPTPDQDQVDEIGRAVGLTYSDDEPLQGEEKLRQRDRNRWELQPESNSELEEDDEEEPEEGEPEEGEESDLE